jgi:hypothetical protein
MGVASARTTLRKASMKMRANETPYLLLLIGAGAVILLGTSAIAAVTAWMPTSTDVAGVVLAVDKLPTLPSGPVGVVAQIPPARAEGAARVRVKCAECGVVASAREIGQFGGGIDPGAAGGLRRGGRNELGKSTQGHEVTVRMKDGSSRAFMAANSANWRAGERVIIIEGTSQSKD